MATTWYTGTTGSYISKHRICNGESVYCDGICTNCSRAEIIFSNKNQTTNGSTPIIHIVKEGG